MVDRYLIDETNYAIIYLPYGPMMVNAHDPLIEMSLQQNIEELKILEMFAQGVVLDIGANVGSHSIHFAKTADYVHAFEPFPNTYYLLCTNLLLNGVRNVTPYNFALGEQVRESFVPNLDPSLSNTPMGVQVDKGTLPISMVTLDSLALHPLHFIKIDVEGYEYSVLVGATKSLQRENPIVFVEIHQAVLVDRITDFMTQLGYLNKELFTVMTPREQFLKQPTSYQFDDIRQLDDDFVILTRSYLFWKEGRIQWVG